MVPMISSRIGLWGRSSVVVMNRFKLGSALNTGAAFFVAECQLLYITFKICPCCTVLKGMLEYLSDF